MPVYQSPGVFIEEVPAGPKPIAGVPTSTAAFVGRTERGLYKTPKRLSSWNDYLVEFGGFIEDSYTADSVFGFFQNGGTACFVSRADEGKKASWPILDDSGKTALTVEASSGGLWGNGLHLSFSRQLDVGTGALAATAITRDVTTADGVMLSVPVRDTGGFKVGMKVGIDAPGSGTTEVEATVNSVSDSAVEVTPDGSGSFSADVSWMYAKAEKQDGNLVLGEGSGFLKGDQLLVFVPGSSDRPRATISSISKSEAGTQLALEDTGLDDDFNGARFTRRQVVYDLSLSEGSDAHVTLSQLTWGDKDAFKLKIADMGRGDALITPDGKEVMWDFANKRFGISRKDAKGSVGLKAGLMVFPITGAVTAPAGDEAAILADLFSRYGWLPQGSVMTVSDAGGANSFTAKRQATAFVVDTGTVDSAVTYARAALVNDFTKLKSKGFHVFAAKEPSDGDFVDLKGAILRIGDVKSPDGAPANVYHLSLEEEDGSAGTTGEEKYAVKAWQKSQVVAARFELAVSRFQDGQEIEREEFRSLAFNKEHKFYYAREGVVIGMSKLISLVPGDADAGFPAKLGARDAGAKGELSVASIAAAINALEEEDEPAILACPDALMLEDSVEKAAAFGRMITHAEKMRRFAVVDLPDAPDDKLLDFRAKYLDSTYAAAYAPFLKTINPLPNPDTLLRAVPPSGFVTGVYARTDQTRGVHKAPANEAVRGVSEVKRKHTTSQQDALNPKSVNLIRAFPGRGIRVWGARNLTDDTQWRYVNVRRLFLFIENSIDRGTQWVVFEPNNEATWLRVRVTVENFLNGIWRSGGLAGTTPEEAYRVRVGRGLTMTETDIDLGKMIIEVAIAPTKPAEFVIFRISHKRVEES